MRCYLSIVPETMGDRLAEVSGDDLAHYVASMIEGEGIKVLAKRRKEDGLVTHIAVGIGRNSRRLLDRQELVEEADYRRAVQESEKSTLSKAMLSPPVGVTLEEWRRDAKKGHLSGPAAGGE
jgi:hypothetical protein